LNDRFAPDGKMERISIAEKFIVFAEQWPPKIVAELNGQEVKLVKVQGTFPWHNHDDVDEMLPSGIATGPRQSGRRSVLGWRPIVSERLDPGVSDLPCEWAMT
jgi:hypothetical protein